mmetsp:Transcript_60791/g.131881  ORF Transcript_60791/g.131881 Transcript_60791/m.131881 type:complete len:343 (+) Transcript_60791:330-1358(+)
MVLNDLDDLTEIKLRVLLHLRCGALLDSRERSIVSLEHVGEIEDGAAVTAIKHAGKVHAWTQRRHKLPEDVVVSEEPCRVIVNGDEALVFSILFVAVVVGNGSAMPAVVEEEGVACGGALHQPPHGLFHRSLSWILILPVIDENLPLCILVAVLREVLLHCHHVVDTAAELATGTNIVDADEQGPGLATGLWIQYLEGGIEVHGPAAAQLRNLSVLPVQDIAHSLQETCPGVGLLRLQQRLDHRVCTGPASSTWAGVRRKPKRSRVLNVRRGLAVLAAAEHNHRGGHHVLGFRSKRLTILRCLAFSQPCDCPRVPVEGPLFFLGRVTITHCLRAGPTTRAPA